jgi:hypothetical protein
MRSADLFVGFLDDRKVQRAMARAGSDAIVAYLSVVLASWRDERPAQLADELPLALEARLEELQGVLVQVGLLTPAGAIPDDVWDRRLGPAIATADRGRERKRAYRERVASASRDGDKPRTGRPRNGDNASRDMVPSRSVPVPTPNGVRNGEKTTPPPAPVGAGRAGASTDDLDDVGTIPWTDPFGETVQLLARSAVPAPTKGPRPPCVDDPELFRAHASGHRLAGSTWKACELCGWTAPSFRDKLAQAGYQDPRTGR